MACRYCSYLAWTQLPCGLQKALQRAIVVWEGLAGVIGVWDNLAGSGIALRGLEGLSGAAQKVGINILSCPALSELTMESASHPQVTKVASCGK